MLLCEVLLVLIRVLVNLTEGGLARGNFLSYIDDQPPRLSDARGGLSIARIRSGVR
jgi:hypothetical protein